MKHHRIKSLPCNGDVLILFALPAVCKWGWFLWPTRPPHQSNNDKVMETFREKLKLRFKVLSAFLSTKSHVNEGSPKEDLGAGN